MFQEIVHVAAVCIIVVLGHSLWCLLFGPLSQIPGPKLFAFTKLRLVYEDYSGTRTRTIHRLHQEYGAAVRVGPKEVSFNSLAALRQIYGAGSKFGRPRPFYRAFDVYTRPTMFTVFSSAEHAERKKATARIYAKSTVLNGPVAASIQSKVKKFLDLIETDPETGSHIEKRLHCYSLDNISWMIFRGHEGTTSALTRQASHLHTLSDIDKQGACKSSWFRIHAPWYTGQVFSSRSLLESILNSARSLPAEKHPTNNLLQNHVLVAFNEHRGGDMADIESEGGLVRRLLDEKAENGGSYSLSNMDIVAECVDHLDAGLKTTSDTLMFALWALSLPSSQKYQQRLIAEVDSVRDLLSDKTVSSVAECDRLPFLDAIVKETLRLYSPIPASQPRVSQYDATIDGFLVPAGVVVSCQAYSLHRNPEVYPEPHKFNPDRWLSNEADIATMRRWWWPFSSGARMCLGMHLALAEITTLLVAIYQRYSTTASTEFQLLSPTATSRFELVYDDLAPIVEGKEFQVEFKRR